MRFLPTKHPRRKRNRLQYYDYSQDGWYFVTICVKNMKRCFGEIEDDVMVLNGYGKVINQFWQEIPNHYSNVKLDESVIMPNHIHGIIIIKNDNIVAPEKCSVPATDPDCLSVGTKQCSVPATDPDCLSVAPEKCSVPTTDPDCLSVGTEHCSVPTGGKYGLLSKVIKSFKEACTKQIRKRFDDYNFGWQRSFYDHVIRKEESLTNIRKYIRDNPLKWALDRYNV